MVILHVGWVGVRSSVLESVAVGTLLGRWIVVGSLPDFHLEGKIGKIFVIFLEIINSVS